MNGKKQQDRRSLYQSRLASLLSQGIEDSKLEEYIRHKIDDAAAHIHVLKIISTSEVSSYGSVRRTPQAS